MIMIDNRTDYTTTAITMSKFWWVTIFIQSLHWPLARSSFLLILCLLSLLCCSSRRNFHFWAIFIKLYFNQMRSSLYLQSEGKTYGPIIGCYLSGKSWSMSQYFLPPIFNCLNQLPLISQIGFTTSFSYFSSVISVAFLPYRSFVVA